MRLCDRASRAPACSDRAQLKLVANLARHVISIDSPLVGYVALRLDAPVTHILTRRVILTWTVAVRERPEAGLPAAPARCGAPRMTICGTKVIGQILSEHRRR
jgi:hypothetical protein